MSKMRSRCIAENFRPGCGSRKFRKELFHFLSCSTADKIGRGTFDMRRTPELEHAVQWDPRGIRPAQIPLKYASTISSRHDRIKTRPCHSLSSHVADTQNGLSHASGRGQARSCLCLHLPPDLRSEPKKKSHATQFEFYFYP